jgi:hypothetical protein
MRRAQMRKVVKRRKERKRKKDRKGEGIDKQNTWKKMYLDEG